MSTTSSEPTAKNGDYGGWSSAQLIDRIKYLELQLAIQSSSKPTPSVIAKPKPPAKTPRTFDFSKYSTRYIAVKFAYLGWHFNGVAYCDPALTPLPTVELELFKALERKKLIQSMDTCNYSRCGRTDKGVSAMGQVSAMTVRSNVQPEDRIENGGRGYSLDDKGNSKGEEFDYVNILNAVLPSTIRVLAWSPVPDDFNARFSCRGRHYRYFFTNVNQNLDIDAMRKAAGYFLHENDFRNFCKLDVDKQVTNFKRTMYRAEIVPYEGVPPNNNSQIYTFELQGSAFLWHQVRCMMSILLLVGQGLEKPEVVRDLLDIEKYPTKPEYEMAHDVPLVFYDCLYDNIEWIYPKEGSQTRQRLLAQCFSIWHESKLHEALAGLLCTAASQSPEIQVGNTVDGRVGWTGSGEWRSIKSYQPVAKRKRQEAFGDVVERYRKSAKYEQRQRKREAKEKSQGAEDRDDTQEQ